MADHVGFSKNYLSNLFKQETGTTIWNYLLDVRMKKAREMLLNTDLKLYEIADRLGYSEQIYFSRMFKERYGLSPLEFKKRIEQ
ncbi:Arabinose operon regulatory protein [compost metagenome]